MKTAKALFYSAVAFILILVFAAFYSASGFTVILPSLFTFEGLAIAFIFIFANAAQVE